MRNVFVRDGHSWYNTHAVTQQRGCYESRMMLVSQGRTTQVNGECQLITDHEANPRRWESQI